MKIARDGHIISPGIIAIRCRLEELLEITNQTSNPSMRRLQLLSYPRHGDGVEPPHTSLAGTTDFLQSPTVRSGDSFEATDLTTSANEPLTTAMPYCGS